MFIINITLSNKFQTLNNWLRQRLGADANQDPVDALANYLHSEAITFLELGFHQDCEAFRGWNTLRCCHLEENISDYKAILPLKNLIIISNEHLSDYPISAKSNIVSYPRFARQ